MKSIKGKEMDKKEKELIQKLVNEYGVFVNRWQSLCDPITFSNVILMITMAIAKKHSSPECYKIFIEKSLDSAVDVANVFENLK
jgi:hypothetical protein